ncbi:DoxX-like family protein [Nonlabens sp. Hel1_33_55]|uniref:DoxX family protein n=1 Tax=Nonlabens sp. Hel1_33_55 TaxID=1336802 RepID=UPI000875E005|nr:DoxX family protein [Nonlabens sp. Hel1_33_55]SCY03823.1 DoxX-like family protein [Nonlabens sp. Hel1_33_55]
MDYTVLKVLEIIIKLAIGLSILNVWLLNRKKATPWRAQNATTMREEFAVYGLSKSMMVIVGTLKCFFAVLLLISIFYPSNLFPSIEWIGAAGIALMMAVAISMHFKVGDPPKKSLPAAIFMILSIIVIFI